MRIVLFILLAVGCLLTPLSLGILIQDTPNFHVKESLSCSSARDIQRLMHSLWSWQELFVIEQGVAIHRTSLPTHVPTIEHHSSLQQVVLKWVDVGQEACEAFLDYTFVPAQVRFRCGRNALLTLQTPADVLLAYNPLVNGPPRLFKHIDGQRFLTAQQCQSFCPDANLFQDVLSLSWNGSVNTGQSCVHIPVGRDPLTSSDYWVCTLRSLLDRDQNVSLATRPLHPLNCSARAIHDDAECLQGCPVPCILRSGAWTCPAPPNSCYCNFPDFAQSGLFDAHDTGNRTFDCSCCDGYHKSPDFFAELGCLDDDECLLDLCADFATCTNLPGTFSCACNEGYAGDGVTLCEPTCSCPVPNQICMDGQDPQTCACRPTFVDNGHGGCVFDACTVLAGSTCTVDQNETCTNDPLATLQYTCNCTTPFTTFNYTSGVCDCDCRGDDNAQCLVSTPNTSAVCTCHSGYVHTAPNAACVDVNECLQGTHACDALQGNCTNTVGGYSCSCNSGFAGNGLVCASPCATSTCQAHTTCIALANGTQNCVCDFGFLPANATLCIDNDECALHTDNCHSTFATCNNTQGSFTCTCNDGFSGNGISCTDIDECTTLGPSACDPHANCTNHLGGYACTCQTGYSGNGSVCTDNNECLANPCAANATCNNTQGSFSCQCNLGYNGTGFVCMDVDECTQELNNCHPWAVCYNAPGSFTCECDTGTLGDGLLCTDIDECANASHYCSPHAVNCTNLNGTFTCGWACNAGYSGNGYSCTDDNECLANPCPIHSVCNNTDGSFACICDTGFLWNGTACNDVDECNFEFAVCAPFAECNNTPGNYSCSCLSGYQGDPYVNCSDIDECSLPGYCDTPNSQCTNQGGGFLCECNAGFVNVAPSGPLECNLIDSCDGNTCAVEATCFAFNATAYTCECNVGYDGNGFVCNDVDECGTNVHNCEAMQSFCNNTIGSFLCGCTEGYVGDGIANCTDVDECASHMDNCDNATSICANDVPGFSCACKDGFSKHNATCQDTDECVDNTHNCSLPLVCVNTFGAFTCNCTAGYDWNGTTCVDLDECVLNVHNCSAVPHTTCHNNLGSYVCQCSAGYALNIYAQCTPVCTSCANGTCDQTNNCSCPSGYRQHVPSGYDYFGNCSAFCSSCYNGTCLQTSTGCACAPRLFYDGPPLDVSNSLSEYFCEQDACSPASGPSFCGGNATCLYFNSSFHCEYASVCPEFKKWDFGLNRTVCQTQCIGTYEIGVASEWFCWDALLGSPCSSPDYIYDTRIDQCVNRSEWSDYPHDFRPSAYGMSVNHTGYRFSACPNGTFGVERVSGDPPRPFVDCFVPACDGRGYGTNPVSAWFQPVLGYDTYSAYPGGASVVFLPACNWASPDALTLDHTKQVHPSYWTCADGYSYLNGTGCISCTPGTFSVNNEPTHNNWQCDLCFQGRYQGLAGQSSCDACAADTFSREGQVSCTSCPAGPVAGKGPEWPPRMTQMLQFMQNIAPGEGFVNTGVVMPVPDSDQPIADFWNLRELLLDPYNQRPLLLTNTWHQTLSTQTNYACDKIVTTSLPASFSPTLSYQPTTTLNINLHTDYHLSAILYIWYDVVNKGTIPCQNVTLETSTIQLAPYAGELPHVNETYARVSLRYNGDLLVLDMSHILGMNRSCAAGGTCNASTLGAINLTRIEWSATADKIAFPNYTSFVSQRLTCHSPDDRLDIRYLGYPTPGTTYNVVQNDKPLQVIHQNTFNFSTPVIASVDGTTVLAHVTVTIVGGQYVRGTSTTFTPYPFCVGKQGCASNFGLSYTAGGWPVCSQAGNSCPPGSVYEPEEAACVMIDECQMNPCPSGELCTDTSLGYFCCPNTTVPDPKTSNCILPQTPVCANTSNVLNPRTLECCGAFRENCTLTRSCYDDCNACPVGRVRMQLGSGNTTGANGEFTGCFPTPCPPAQDGEVLVGISEDLNWCKYMNTTTQANVTDCSLMNIDYNVTCTRISVRQTCMPDLLSHEVKCCDAQSVFNVQTRQCQQVCPDSATHLNITVVNGIVRPTCIKNDVLANDTMSCPDFTTMTSPGNCNFLCGSPFDYCLDNEYFSQCTNNGLDGGALCCAIGFERVPDLTGFRCEPYTVPVNYATRQRSLIPGVWEDLPEFPNQCLVNPDFSAQYGFY